MLLQDNERKRDLAVAKIMKGSCKIMKGKELILYFLINNTSLKEVNEGHKINHVDRRSHKGQSKIVYKAELKLSLPELGYADYCGFLATLHMRICF